MNGGLSGFQNAPVTRNLLIACAFLTVVFVVRGRSAHLGFSYQSNFGSTTASIPETLESSVIMLASMGFDSNSARQALVRARNDINVATNILLEALSR